MAFDLTPLLLSSEDVPPRAKQALQAARSAPLAEREQWLRSAASALTLGTPLACDEARELVGLPPGSCG